MPIPPDDVRDDLLKFKSILDNYPKNCKFYLNAKMGKRCVVNNCKSGYKENVKRIIENIRQVSVFKVPKNSTLRKKWIDALQQHLSDKDVVCEFHFAEGSIKKSETVYVGERIIKIPYLRWRLQSEAVPLSHFPVVKTSEVHEQGLYHGSDCQLEKEQVQVDCEKVQYDESLTQNIGSISEFHENEFQNNDSQPDLQMDCHIVEFDRSSTDNIISEFHENEFQNNDSQPDLQMDCQNVEFDRSSTDNIISEFHENEFQNNDSQPDLQMDCQNVEFDRSSTENIQQKVGELIELNDILSHFKAAMPEGWLHFEKSPDIFFIYYEVIDLTEPKVKLRCTSEMVLMVSFKNRQEIDTGIKVATIQNIFEAMNKFSSRPLCEGTEIGNRYSLQCTGVIDDTQFKRRRRFPRCKNCSDLRRKLITLRKNKENSSKTLCPKNQYLHRKNRRLLSQMCHLKGKMAALQTRCSRLSNHSFYGKIEELDPSHQLAVQACFDAARRKTAKGRRYQLEWIYECLLIRMKRGGLYNFIRQRGILPLPHINTLNRYIQKISSSAYGFQPALFNCLKLKASGMPSFQRRGVLLVDEMKISESLSFNKQIMQFCGFVNLGKHTPKYQKNDLGDHALVFMFVPFCGRWVQAIACFISKNMAPSNILHKLIMECIILLENSNICVDVVTSDGAQSNRGVWNILGVTEESLSIEHPCDQSRKLFFMSDFSHLIKCLRNNIVRYSSFNTPYGTVKKSHWINVLQLENYSQPNLKIAYKLTPAHINPQGYQKMNVLLAYQLFSSQIATAMKILADVSEGLQDSLPSQRFIQLVDSLIVAMTSRTPATALKYGNYCQYKSAIQEFLCFLETWETQTSAHGERMPISSSTLVGLKVTLKATIQLVEYLHYTKDHYKYLMTSRLSQDPLERFFSIMRGACGSNDHPDPTLFGQVFRLMSSFSLVRSPKGCNVPGPELLKSLMQTKDSLALTNEPRKEWLEKIDTLLENGAPIELQTNTSVVDHFTDHTYTLVNTSDEVQAYMAGYIVRRMKRSVNCQYCLKTLIATDEEKTRLHSQCELIRLTNLYDGLHYPSVTLFLMTKALEQCILYIVNSFGVEADTMERIITEVRTLEIPRIGCEEHQQRVTSQAIDLYLVMRGHFLSKTENRKNVENQQKTKMHRKSAKLY